MGERDPWNVRGAGRDAPREIAHRDVDESGGRELALEFVELRKLRDRPALAPTAVDPAEEAARRALHEEAIGDHQPRAGREDTRRFADRRALARPRRVAEALDRDRALLARRAQPRAGEIGEEEADAPAQPRLAIEARGESHLLGHDRDAGHLRAPIAARHGARGGARAAAEIHDAHALLLGKRECGGHFEVHALEHRLAVEGIHAARPVAEMHVVAGAPATVVVLGGDVVRADLLEVRRNSRGCRIAHQRLPYRAPHEHQPHVRDDGDGQDDFGAEDGDGIHGKLLS